MKWLFRNKLLILLNSSLALLLTFIIWQSGLLFKYPYELKKDLQKLVNQNQQTVYYHDFDKDDKFEKIKFGLHYRDNIYFIYIESEVERVIDQIDFRFTSRNDLVKFADWNGDNKDEILIFTYDENNLYLTVSEFGVNKIIFKEKPILAKPPQNTQDKWLLGYLDISIENFKNTRQLILMVTTGHGIYPRGVYSFDTNTLQILGKFEVSANLSAMQIIDLDNNGEKEIYVSSFATGNDKSKKGFHDFNTWLFKLNKNIELIKAKDLGGYFPSGNIIKHRDGIKQNFLFSIQSSVHSNSPSGYYLIDMELSTYKHFKMNSNTSHRDLSILLFENNNFYYVIGYEGNLIKLDNEFEIIIENKFERENAVSLDCADLLGSENEEIIIWGSDYISILDNEFRTLAYLKLDDEHLENRQRAFISSSKQFGFASIGFNYDKYEYVLSIHRDKIFENRYPVFIGLFILGIFVFSFAEYFYLKLISHIHLAHHLTVETSTPIILFNSYGQVEFTNPMFNNLVKLAAKTKHLEIKYLQITDELKSLFYLCIKNKKPVSEKISFLINHQQYCGKVYITPIIVIPFIYSKFMAEFIDYSDTIITERTNNWSKISQKIAHDIKTPLSTIQLNLSALKSRLTGNNIKNQSQVNDDIDMIQNEVKHISNLTKSFLKFSNLEKPNYQWVNPLEIIEKSAEPFKKYFDDGIKFEYEIDEGITSIWVDPNQMEQMLHILIENSIDAIETRGNIKISAELVEKLQHQNDGNVEFLITDNGQGISEEEKNKIFEPYFTQKKDGTGMGLTIAKKIIEDHGGSIEINSKLNFGTTVIIKIPHNQES